MMQIDKYTIFNINKYLIYLGMVSEYNFVLNVFNLLFYFRRI